jgi:hypothetical protein
MTICKLSGFRGHPVSGRASAAQLQDPAIPNGHPGGDQSQVDPARQVPSPWIWRVVGPDDPDAGYSSGGRTHVREGDTKSPEPKPAGSSAIKLFFVTDGVQNKLECLSLARFFRACLKFARYWVNCPTYVALQCPNLWLCSWPCMQILDESERSHQLIFCSTVCDGNKKFYHIGTRWTSP